MAKIYDFIREELRIFNITKDVKLINEKADTVNKLIGLFFRCRYVV